jgi:hypothetical protein
MMDLIITITTRHESYGSAPSRATLYTGRFATRFGFEFTPTPKIFGMILSQASRKNIHQPSFHRENLAAIPQMRDMVLTVA